MKSKVKHSIIGRYLILKPKLEDEVKWLINRPQNNEVERQTKLINEVIELFKDVFNGEDGELI